MPRQSTTYPPLSPAVLLVTMLMVAATLRAPINGVGPILPQIAAALDLSHTQQGLLGALPVLCFAIMSPLVPWVSRPLGYQRTVGVSLVVLAIGIAVRSLEIPGAIWVGTVLLCCAIAVGGVLIPALVKVNFRGKTAVVMAAYSAIMGLFSAIAGAIAVPLERAYSWHIAIGCWIILTLVALVAWTPRLLRPPVRNMANADEADDHAPSMWTNPLAWWIALFMGMQSSMSYLITTWMPTIEQSLGVTPEAAGWHLAVNIVVGNVAGFVIAPLLERRRDVRPSTTATSLFMISGTIGLIVWPAWAFFWVVWIGISQGMGFVIALNLMATRTRTLGESGRLSAMAQGVGYLLAVGGPLVAGFIFDYTLNTTAVLLFLLAMAFVQLTAGLQAGRDVYTSELPTEAA